MLDWCSNNKTWSKNILVRRLQMRIFRFYLRRDIK